MPAALFMGIVEAGSADSEPTVITLSLEKLNRYLGTDLSRFEVKRSLPGCISLAEMRAKD